MSIKTSFSNFCAVLKEVLANKVDKISGKGLSTNDFTAAYKTKLDGIAAGANKTTVDSTINSTSINPVQNKAIAAELSTIKTNVSAAATTAGNAAAIAAAVKKDLANYYKKTETYSQAEIDNKISAIPKFAITVCEALPTSNISKTTVYLLKGKKEDTNNIYDEYIYVNSKWEPLGSQSLDLSGYATTEALNAVKADLSSTATSNSNAIKSIKNQLATMTVDDSLSTTSKKPVQNMVITGQISTIAADLSDLKAWKTNISKTVSDIQTDTATVTTAEFTKMLS